MGSPAINVKKGLRKVVLAFSVRMMADLFKFKFVKKPVQCQRHSISWKIHGLAFLGIFTLFVTHAHSNCPLPGDIWPQAMIKSDSNPHYHSGLHRFEDNRGDVADFNRWVIREKNKEDNWISDVEVTDSLIDTIKGRQYTDDMNRRRPEKGTSTLFSVHILNINKDGEGSAVMCKYEADPKFIKSTDHQSRFVMYPPYEYSELRVKMKVQENGENKWKDGSCYFEPNGLDPQNECWFEFIKK